MVKIGSNNYSHYLIVINCVFNYCWKSDCNNSQHMYLSSIVQTLSNKSSVCATPQGDMALWCHWACRTLKYMGLGQHYNCFIGTATKEITGYACLLIVLPQLFQKKRAPHIIMSSVKTAASSPF